MCRVVGRHEGVFPRTPFHPCLEPGAMNEPTIEKDTGRIEAFSDGVFAIALTLLAFELKAPLLNGVSNASLIAALTERWPEYLAFVNSFASILLMWISHHNIFKAVKQINTRFMLANGVALFFVTATPYATSVLAKYLLTDAASASAALRLHTETNAQPDGHR